MLVEQITPDFASKLCLKIAGDLPDFFGLLDANEFYAKGVQKRINFAAKIDREYVGLLSLDFPYPESASIYWLGVMRLYHRKKIGKSLISQAEKFALEKGVQYLTVETLSPVQNDENYRRTYMFYQSSGFVPMFDLKPEGFEHTMVYMIKKL